LGGDFDEGCQRHRPGPLSQPLAAFGTAWRVARRRTTSSRRIDSILQPTAGKGSVMTALSASALLAGISAAHVALLAKLDKVAPTDAEVLISGATGVGKELYANYIHQNSARAKAPFEPVNCGGLPPDLIENELFGHVGGAFTGARPQSNGLVVAAEGGTLFLDEVDSLPQHCQVKLLRFLQDKKFRRLGEPRLRSANVRIVAATNVDLLAAVRAKGFREDLFFRLCVVPVKVPTLAERPDDIPLLINLFIERCSEAYKLPRIVLGELALDRLKAYSWPGNIRELENCIKYLTCLQLSRAVDPYDLPLLADNEDEDSLPDEALIEAGPLKVLKRDLVDQFERRYLECALRRSGGNIAAAARASGTPRRAFFELMRRRGVAANERRGVPREQADSTLTKSAGSIGYELLTSPAEPT
jgi:DNA-binding NtrC family response regulator